MSATDTARASYESSRNEILERIRLRDNALLAFLGATGVVFGVAAGVPAQPQFLLILPFLSLAAAFIVTQHDRTIGAICAFVTQELEPFFHEHGESAPIWEACSILRGYSFTAILLRSVSQGLLILIPPCVALAWSRTSAKDSSLVQSVWWGALIVTIVAAVAIVSTHLARHRYYHETNWRSATPDSSS